LRQDDPTRRAMRDRLAAHLSRQAEPPLPVERAQICGLTIGRPASARPESPERGWQRFEPAFDPAEAVSLDRVAGRVYRLTERRGPDVSAIEARNQCSGGRR